VTGAVTSETVLVVDDSHSNRLLIGAWLRYAGFQVAEAASGTEALERLPTVQPDLVVLDVNLPDVSGKEVCRRIKADPQFRCLPVLQVSATSILSEDRIEALEGGADAYVTMPVPAGEFLAVARALLRLRRAEEGREAARAEAEAANQAKSDFISRMSHEFRTPLNAILGFAQLLEMEVLTTDQREGVEHILKAGRHLLDLVNEVLDISRIEAGRMDISLEPVEVAPVVREALSLLGPAAAQRGVVLRPPDSRQPGWVRADRQRLLQVLLNLVSNAVKYNRADGWVSVSWRTGETIRIEVCDSGIGIRPDAMARLFQPFQRVDPTTAVEGTGLGLTLSRRLAEAMGGTLDAESAPGQGSRFWIELPATEPPELAGDGEADSAPADSSVILLYVEDNLSNIHLVERILASRPDVRLVTAMQGRLAVELARQQLPHLVLLDLNLPDIPGREVLQRLQAEPGLDTIPVVILSADASPGQVRRLLDAGAAEYLTKPLDVRRFLDVVDRLIAQRTG
jgi:signal transduction histidine kinase